MGYIFVLAAHEAHLVKGIVLAKVAALVLLKKRVVAVVAVVVFAKDSVLAPVNSCSENMIKQ